MHSTPQPDKVYIRLNLSVCAIRLSMEKSFAIYFTCEVSILVWFGNRNRNGIDIMGLRDGGCVLIFNLFANFRIISYGYSST